MRQKVIRNHTISIKRIILSIKGYIFLTRDLEVIETVDYLPYGIQIAKKTPAIDERVRERFTGKEWDQEGGIHLDYFGKRYYDPEIGAFTATDPDKQYFNAYAYGPGNPINGVDKDGRYWIQEHYVYAKGALTGAVDRSNPVDIYYTLEDRNYLEYLVYGAAKDAAQEFAISKIPILGNMLEKLFGVFSLVSQAKEMETLKNNSQELFDARKLPEGKRFETWESADKAAQRIANKEHVPMENWGTKKVEDLPVIDPDR